MAYPFPARKSAQPPVLRANSPRDLDKPDDWRCTHCDKLLGVCRDGRMHLRFARGHEYFASFPVKAVCRGCSTLNRTSGPTG